MNIEKIKAVHPGTYDMNFVDLHELDNVTPSKVEAIILAYKYGFMRGQNAAESSARKKAVKV